jgi:hypothetical protein
MTQFKNIVILMVNINKEIKYLITNFKNMLIALLNKILNKNRNNLLESKNKNNHSILEGTFILK